MNRCTRRLRGQSGASLVEALVVLALVSAVVLVFALGLQTVVQLDGQTNRQQRNNLALTSVTEALRRNDLSFVVCCPDSQVCGGPFAGEPSLAAYYRARAVDKLTADGGDVPNFTITNVAYWQPGDFESTPTVPGAFQTTCIPDATSLRLSVEVALGDGTLKGEVVKRKPLPGESTGAGS